MQIEKVIKRYRHWPHLVEFSEKAIENGKSQLFMWPVTVGHSPDSKPPGYYDWISTLIANHIKLDSINHYYRCICVTDDEAVLYKLLWDDIEPFKE